MLELTSAENPVLRSDLVSETLPHLRDAKRWSLSACLQHACEVGEHPLGRLRAKVGIGSCVSNRPRLRLEHQIELTSLGERTDRPTIRTCVGVVQLVLTVAGLALGAVDQRVRKVGQVSRCLPDLGRAQNRRIDENDIISLLNHGANPRVFHISQQQRPERAVVVGRPKSAVDLCRRVNKTASLTQVDNLVEIGCGHTQQATDIIAQRLNDVRRLTPFGADVQCDAQVPELPTQ